MSKITRQKQVPTERMIMTCSIISVDFLREIRELHKIFSTDVYQNKYCLDIILWCLEYFKDTGKAPVNEIKNIFAVKCENKKYAENKEMYKELLKSANEDYRTGEIDITYWIKEIENYFQNKNKELCSAELNDIIEDKDYEDFDEAIQEYKRKATVNKAEVFSVFSKELSKKAREIEGEPLFKLPGDIGNFLKRDFKRKHFFVVQASKKKGKSWFLQEIGRSAFIHKLKVLHIHFGDMEAYELNMRLAMRFTGMSIDKSKCILFVT